MTEPETNMLRSRYLQLSADLAAIEAEMAAVKVSKSHRMWKEVTQRSLGNLRQWKYVFKDGGEIGEIRTALRWALAEGIPDIASFVIDWDLDGEHMAAYASWSVKEGANV